jgi:hypothetical protein
VKAGEQIALEPRFDGLLSAAVPDIEVTAEQDVRNKLRDSVWLLDDPKVADGGRYVMVAGCEPHNCDSGGFIWVDLATNAAIAYDREELLSRTIDPQHIPPRFWEDVRDRVPPGPEITYRGPSGKSEDIVIPESD